MKELREAGRLSIFNVYGLYYDFRNPGPRPEDAKRMAEGLTWEKQWRLLGQLKQKRGEEDMLRELAMVLHTTGGSSVNGIPNKSGLYKAMAPLVDRGVAARWLGHQPAEWWAVEWVDGKPSFPLLDMKQLGLLVTQKGRPKRIFRGGLRVKTKGEAWVGLKQQTDDEFKLQWSRVDGEPIVRRHFTVSMDVNDYNFVWSVLLESFNGKRLSEALVELCAHWQTCASRGQPTSAPAHEPIQ